MRAFYAFLIAIAVLWAVLRNARAQLYVSSRPEGGLLGVVSEYNATTGEVINANMITGLSFPRALAVSGNKLFVANTVSGTVGEYNATTGEVINANFITGLGGPAALALLGNTLFVANTLSGTVGEYDATTGEVIKANFITGLSNPEGIAVKSAK